jgi:hypothetical protein
MIQPRAAKHQLPQPVDEAAGVQRLDRVSLADEIAAELAAGPGDDALGGQVGQVGRLLRRQVALGTSSSRTAAATTRWVKSSREKL